MLSKESIRQTIPPTFLDAVAQRRQQALYPNRCFYPVPFRISGFWSLSSRFRHLRPSCLHRYGLCASTFLPTFPWHGFAFHTFRKISFLSETSSCRYYEGSESRFRSPRSRASPLTAAYLPGVPSPTTWCARSSLWPPLQRDRLVPGFAIDKQARRYTPPNRVRHPTDRQSASGCSPPRLSATQLPSAAGAVAYPGTDFHRADTRHRGRTYPGFHPGYVQRSLE